MAREIAAVIDRKEALGESFHITTDQHYRWSELLVVYLNAIEEKTGKRTRVILTDNWLDFFGGGSWQVK